MPADQNYAIYPILPTIKRFHVNRLCATPKILTKLRNHPGIYKYSHQEDLREEEKEDLESLKYITCGGALLPIGLKHEIQQALSVKITQGYGMTETTSIIAGGSWTEPENGAVGVLYPNTEAKVLDIQTGKGKTIYINLYLKF